MRRVNSEKTAQADVVADREGGPSARS